MFRNFSTQLQLGLAILIAIFFSDHINIVSKSFFYSLSLFIKNLLVMFLPFIIMSSIYRSITAMKGFSILIIPFLLLFISVSNFCNVLLSLKVGNILIDNDLFFNPITVKVGLPTLFNVEFPKILSNNIALILGFFTGFICFYRKIDLVDKTMMFMYKYSDLLLKKLFIPILPIFIFGFVVKAIHDQILVTLIANIQFFYCMLILVITYLSALYLIASGFRLKRLFFILKNIFPPFVTAFSTMSSAAAMPFSLKASSINCKNEQISQFFISSTVNIHMLGDALSIPILAILVMKLFNVPFDSRLIYEFAFMFMITKFSGAGIPGGTILVMSQVLEKTLGFTPEMIGLITTIYILIDPFTTSGSVLGNNGYVLIFEKICGYFAKSSKEEKIADEFIPKTNQI